VHEALRNLNKEINAIIRSLRNAPQNIPPNSFIVERILDLVLTWSAGVRPSLAVMTVPREVLSRADQVTSRAARLTAKTTPKKMYLSVLHALRRVLMEQVLLEVALIPPAMQIPATTPETEYLFPEISDLPNQLVPNALQGWADPIRRFLRKYPFDKNVFVMVSYRSELSCKRRSENRPRHAVRAGDAAEEK